MSLSNDRTFREPISKLTTFFMVMFHIGAIAALFFFSWDRLAVTVFLWWVAGSLGVGMAYHRLLTHRGFKTYKWLEYFLTTCATLALEGGPFFWVATHRLHHQNTDVEGDPHSPKDGGFWAHMGWIITGRVMHNHSDSLLPYIPDLRKDKFHTFISKWHWVPITAWHYPVGHRRLENGPLGSVPTDRNRPAYDMAGQLSHAHVGQAALPD